METFYTYIAENKRRTWLIIGIFIVLLSLLGYLFTLSQGGDWTWFITMFSLSSGMSVVSFYLSDQVILSISGAKPIKKRDNPRVFRMVENLCLGTGLPLPEIYVINDTAPNAFATGRDPAHAKVVVTSGLLDKLDDQELEGVLAHELAHIGNFDIRLMSIVVVLIGIIALLSDWFRRGAFYRKRDRNRDSSASSLIMILAIMASILAPLISQLLKLAISRQREYLADATAVKTTRYPEGLARALEKISQDQEPLEVANTATAHLYIVNPLKNYSDNMAKLFSTHPPVKDRVARLRAI